MQRLNYQFRQTVLLETALTHRSVCEQPNNERLEFLGDAVLGLMIAKRLMEKFPYAREGELSSLRSNLVKEETLFEIAKYLDLGCHLHLGPGELKSGGVSRKSTLADAVEALIGAIYLDSGIEQCEKIVVPWFESRLPDLENLETADKIQQLKDPKTRLQEYLQAHRLPLPVYKVLSIEGQAHEQHFHISCQISGIDYQPQGSGFSRKEAEQIAAELLLRWFNAKKINPKNKIKIKTNSRA